MGKYIDDGCNDASLTYIKTGCTLLAMCLSQPLTIGAMGTSVLATVAYTTTSLTLADGDTSGRKVIASAATLTVGTSGTVTHVAFYNAGTLFAVGTCAPTAVTATGTIIMSAFDLNEIRDPA